MAVVPQRRRFTLDEYHRMTDAGVFGPEDRLELIEGEIIEMSPIGPRHIGIVNRLTRLLVLRLVDRAVVQVGNPVDLPPASEPEPDLSVLRARDDFYGTRHPEPDDALLVIEVMDTSARFDRGVKLPMYARARVPEVWLVDAKRDLVEVHRQPTGNRYGSLEVRRRGATLAIAAFPDVTFTVDDAIGPATPTSPPRR